MQAPLIDPPQQANPSAEIRREAENKLPYAGLDHPSPMVLDYRKRFWISLVSTLPILSIRQCSKRRADFEKPFRFPDDICILFGLSSAVFWNSSWPFLNGSKIKLMVDR